jgi:hypothetical protein
VAHHLVSIAAEDGGIKPTNAKKRTRKALVVVVAQRRMNRAHRIILDRTHGEILLVMNLLLMEAWDQATIPLGTRTMFLISTETGIHEPIDERTNDARTEGTGVRSVTMISNSSRRRPSQGILS